VQRNANALVAELTRLNIQSTMQSQPPALSKPLTSLQIPTPEDHENRAETNFAPIRSLLTQFTLSASSQYDYLYLRHNIPRCIVQQVELDEVQRSADSGQDTNVADLASGSHAHARSQFDATQTHLNILFSDAVEHVSTGQELSLAVTGNRMYLLPPWNPDVCLTLHLADIELIMIGKITDDAVPEVLIRSYDGVAPDWRLRVPHLSRLLEVIHTAFETAGKVDTTRDSAVNAATREGTNEEADETGASSTHSIDFANATSVKLPTLLMCNSTSLHLHVTKNTALEQFLNGSTLPFEHRIRFGDLISTKQYPLPDNLRHTVYRALQYPRSKKPRRRVYPLSLLPALIFFAPCPPGVKHWSWVMSEARTQFWANALLLLTATGVFCYHLRRFMKFRTDRISREATLLSFSVLENQSVAHFENLPFPAISTSAWRQGQTSMESEVKSEAPAKPAGVMESTTLYTFTLFDFGSMDAAATGSFLLTQTGDIANSPADVAVPNASVLTLACRSENECAFWISAVDRHIRSHILSRSRETSALAMSTPDETFEEIHGSSIRPKVILVDHSDAASQDKRRAGLQSAWFSPFIRSEGWVYRFDEPTHVWRPCYLTITEQEIWCLDVGNMIQLPFHPSPSLGSAGSTESGMMSPMSPDVVAPRETQDATQLIEMTKLPKCATVKQELPTFIGDRYVQLPLTNLPPLQNNYDVRFKLKVAGREKTFAVDSDSDFHLWATILGSPHINKLSSTAAAAGAEPVGDPLTFVHTDVQGSTDAWETEPCMFQALKMHDNIMWEAIQRFKGREGGTQGDAFQVIFRDPVAALKWCIYVQHQLTLVDWPGETFRSSYVTVPLPNGGTKIVYAGLRVRMGIHTGSNIEKYYSSSTRREQLEGRDADIGQKVADTAHGGQIILTRQALNAILQAPSWKSSRSTIEVDDFVYLDYGYFEGNDEPIHIYEAKQSLFRERVFPPLRNLSKTKPVREAPKPPITLRDLESLDDFRTLSPSHNVLGSNFPFELPPADEPVAEEIFQ